MAIGLNSAVAKILCGKHNSALSEFDSEAIKLSRFLSANVIKDPKINSAISLNGTYIEKWALKTFLNLGYLCALHREQPHRLEPRVDLVHYIFRNTDITEGVGLYFISGAISNHDYRAGVSWSVIQNREQLGEIFGLVLEFFGIRLVVSIALMRAENIITGLGEINGFDYATAGVFYRAPNIVLSRQDAGQKAIYLKW